MSFGGFFWGGCLSALVAELKSELRIISLENKIREVM